MLSIEMAPGMMVVEVGDRAKVKEGCDWGGYKCKERYK
jgi:hypothetical protein